MNDKNINRCKINLKESLGVRDIQLKSALRVNYSLLLPYLHSGRGSER